MTIRESMLNTLVEIWPAVVSHITPKGKSLDENGQFTIYNQCIGIYFSTLFSEESPYNPYYQSPKALELAIKCWDTYYNFTLPNGKTQTITMDQYWFDEIEEWSTLHWLNSIELLEPYLDCERLKKWRNRCYAACEAIAMRIRNDYETGIWGNDLAKNSVSNHILWFVTCAYRYSQIINNRELEELCTTMMTMVADGQHPSGTWLEGGSTVLAYATVSFGAIATFCSYSKNKYPKIVEAGVKCIDYLINCSYGNLSPIGTIDIRNIYDYSQRLTMHIPAAFINISKNAHLFSCLCVRDKYRKKIISHKHQALGFYLYAFLEMPSDTDFLEESILIAKSDYIIPDIKARVIRKDNWVVSMCIQNQQVLDNRWILERMNLISIGREYIGEIIGGGHSTSTMNLATFNIVQHGKCEYLPTNGELTKSGISAEYNGAQCNIDFININSEGFVIKYTIQKLLETGYAKINIPLYITEGETIKINGKDLIIDEKHISIKLSGGDSIILKNTIITIDAPCVFTYPIYAFNTYTKQQSPGFKEARAVISSVRDYIRNTLCVDIRLE